MMTTVDGGVVGGSVAVVTTCSGIGVVVCGVPDGISVSMVVVVESGAVTGGPVTLSSGALDT